MQFVRTMLYCGCGSQMATHLSYLAMITKRCANDACGKEFESEPYWNKKYCSHTCYKKAKVFRRVAKDKTIPFKFESIDSRYLFKLTYPSTERLNREASLIQVGEYGLIEGMNHMWTPPEDISFVQQGDEDIWVMTKKEIIPDFVKQMLKIK